MTSSAESVRLEVKRLRVGARLPYRASELATGWDVYAALDRPVEVGQFPVVIATGIAIAVPPGWDVQVRPRSGLARRGVLSTLGTIDADYRGELMVTMYTVSAGIRHVVRDGDRIAQLVVARHAELQLTEVEELGATTRGERGHGSTGR